MKRIAFLLVLAMVLAACSLVPLPVTTDLQARLGAEASGSFETDIAAGEFSSVRLPSETGETIDFSDADMPATLEYAELDYDITLRYQGPPLTGRLTAQLYVAPVNGEELWQPKYLLVGEDFDLSVDETTLVGTVALTEEQIQAVNDKRLRYGVVITGQNASAQESGRATFFYQVDELLLRAGVSVI